MATGRTREAREEFLPDSIVMRGRLSNVDGSFLLSRLRGTGEIISEHDGVSPLADQRRDRFPMLRVGTRSS